MIYGDNMRSTLKKTTVYQIPSPKDQVKEGNHQFDTKTDSAGKHIRGEIS